MISRFPVLLILLLTACTPTWRRAGETATRQGQLATDALHAEAVVLRQRHEPEAVAGALARYQRLIGAEPTSLEFLLAGAEAASWLAERGPEAERLARARLAVEYAGEALRLAPGDARAHYRRAVGLGLFVREQPTAAPSQLPKMVEHAEKVVASDPDLEHAGGHRYLCQLLAQAPAWPAGPGDLESAIEHGEQAVERAPDYPPNQLALADAYRRDDRPEDARRAARLARGLARASADPDASRWLTSAEKLLASLE